MITTKKGDRGKSYWKDREVDKDDVLMEAIGSLDELQSILGISRAVVKSNELKEKIKAVQNDLKIIGSELVGYSKEKDLKTEEVEKVISKWEEELPKLNKFVIPGENMEEAMLHWCRTVARRCERRIVAVSKVIKINSEVLKYMNRLSDYLFMMSIKIVR